MDNDEKFIIAGELRVAQRMCRNAENGVGDNEIVHALACAAHAVRCLEEAITRMRAVLPPGPST